MRPRRVYGKIINSLSILRTVQRPVQNRTSDPVTRLRRQSTAPVILAPTGWRHSARISSVSLWADFYHLVCPGRSSNKPSLALHSRSPSSFGTVFSFIRFSLPEPRSPLGISILVLSPRVRHLLVDFISHCPSSSPSKGVSGLVWCVCLLPHSHSPSTRIPYSVPQKTNSQAHLSPSRRSRIPSAHLSSPNAPTVSSNSSSTSNTKTLVYHRSCTFANCSSL